MTDDSPQTIFSDDEKDILQEIMNIAFGNSTTNLTSVLDIFVDLSIPNIQAVSADALAGYIEETIDISGNICVVDQKFLGEFKGSGLLVLPYEAGKELRQIVQSSENKQDEPAFKSQAASDSELIMEVSNILINSCVGKISELLNTSVTYTPPQIITGEGSNNQQIIKALDPNHTAIVMKTLFSFKQKNITGLLLIITSQESIKWLRDALAAFIESYE